MTFDQLPESEKIAVRSAIRAVNAVTEARSAEEIEGQAFKNRQLRGGGRGYLYEQLFESAKRAGRSDLSALHGAQLEARYDEMFRAAAVEMRSVLVDLVRTRRLPERGGAFLALAATFMSDVFAGWQVSLSESGHAQIDLQLRFKSALGLIAFVILRLSEISAEARPLLQCAECGSFKLVESTGGDKPERFCSTKCRNRFTVRKWRSDQKVAAAKPRRKSK